MVEMVKPVFSIVKSELTKVLGEITRGTRMSKVETEEQHVYFS